ncbi:LysR family transcriptional regulator [Xanthomonas axonopodis pv. begoniae]|nr:LysR family transcriptional regulator [Xanthomonas axonopodis pv. begoniae]MBO9771004.1 LysR family transcriptional regulator [Xanthomonas axonopodis pv. begoniae]PPT38927.1 LysR family transcriptional regulator [Xanthomonas axonopodis pv. begoniae]
MDHLQAIRAFARVVETGGFNRAAESLQMPNATLSKSISALEKHLGVKLLERSTRRVRVSNDGAAYYERVRHLLTEPDDVEATLGCAQGSTDRTVDVIGENIDCAIRSTADDGALISRKIGSLAWTTCASPDYLVRYGVPTHPEQLKNPAFPVVGYFSAHSGKAPPLHFLDDGAPLEIVPNCSVMVNESNAHLATGLAGLGLIHTLDFMVRPAIERGALVPVLQGWRPAPLDVFIAYAPSRQLSTKVRVFIEWVSEIYARIGRTPSAAER